MVRVKVFFASPFSSKLMKLLDRGWRVLSRSASEGGFFTCSLAFLTFGFLSFATADDLVWADASETAFGKVVREIRFEGLNRTRAGNVLLAIPRRR